MRIHRTVRCLGGRRRRPGASVVPLDLVAQRRVEREVLELLLETRMLLSVDDVVRALGGGSDV